MENNNTLIFETRLDKNGDYAGFTFYQLGNSLNRKDKEAIENFASSFYNSFITKDERELRLSIGNVVVVGGNHPATTRNKMVQGFLLEPPKMKSGPYTSQMPTSLQETDSSKESSEDEKQKSENEKRKFEDKKQKRMKELSINWLLEMAKAIPPLKGDKQNDIDNNINLLIREINDPKIVLNPKDLIVSFLNSVANSEGFNTSRFVHLINFIDSTLTDD